MTTFPPLPVNATTRIGVATGSKLDAKTAVLTANFGDRYSQRVADGINATYRGGAIKFTNLRRGEAIILDEFFTERAGYKPFRWLVPGESAFRNWICPAWDRNFGFRATESMNATFEENFDP